MKHAALAFLALIAITVQADEVRIYQTNSRGNIQYHKPSLTVRVYGCVIQTDAHGNRLYHKQQYLVWGDGIVPVRAIGMRQYGKPALVMKGQKMDASS